MLLNSGGGSFRAKRDYRAGHAAYSVAIGDLNGDGKPDLVTANAQANTVSVLLNVVTAASRPSVDYATRSRPDRSRSVT